MLDRGGKFATNLKRSSISGWYLSITCSEQRHTSETWIDWSMTVSRWSSLFLSKIWCCHLQKKLLWCTSRVYRTIFRSIFFKTYQQYTHWTTDINMNKCSTKRFVKHSDNKRLFVRWLTKSRRLTLWLNFNSWIRKSLNNMWNIEKSFSLRFIDWSH
jgi:hypothetical protein